MVEPCEIPADALLRRYRVEGCFTDCYTTTLAGTIALPAYVEAFYTTPLFRLERAILGVVGRRSTDEHARALAQGTRAAFAAWTVEDRTADQLLLCDVLGRTRSWLMVAPDDAGNATRLFFGSAVVPKRDPRTGELGLGTGYTALLGFHKRYSVALLGAARSALEKSGRG